MTTHLTKWRRCSVLWGLVVACLLCGGYVRADDEISQIHISKDASQVPVSFEVSGLTATQLDSLRTLQSFDPTFAKVFAVYGGGEPLQNERDALPPISGQYKIDGTMLTFVPRHSLRPGLTYWAILHTGDAESKKIIRSKITTPERLRVQATEPTVESVYPSAEKLPENLLRFYIHFSQPMAYRDAYQNLELLDETGKPIEAAFLELGEELWDRSGRRFTLLLDPGRVKQGLKPREELGSVLKDGGKYTLLVKQGWRDANGQTLKSEFRKSFVVGPVVNEAIGWKDWPLSAPLAGTTDSLIVTFDRTLDHALLRRMLWVEDEAGHSVRGTIEISVGETRWRFRPADEWNAGQHRLMIDCALEDTAGNRIDRSFEVVRQDSDVAEKTPTVECRSFTVLKSEPSVRTSQP